MRTVLSTADKLKAGQMLCVNDRLEWITEVERLENGRLRVRWSWGGVLVKPETPFAIHYPNARFWVYWNGDWVKLTLEPGQRMWFGMSHPTDEGWASETHEYCYDDNEMVILSNVKDDGVDCDGRLTRYSTHSCPVSELKILPAVNDQYGPMPPRPHWRREHASQRDYAAEAAGY